MNRLGTDKLTFAYHMQGEGPVLLLLHGFTGSRNTWQPFIADWAKKYTVIAIDLPGHGQTEGSVDSMDDLMSELRQLMEIMQIKKWHILGYSMGGRVALAFANEYPETILSLTLESASPGINNEQAREERQITDEKLARKIEEEGIKSFVHYWENIPLFQTQKALSSHTIDAIRKERLSQTVRGLSQSLRTIGTGKQKSYWERLPSLNIPVHLIVGATDEKFVATNEKMAEQLSSVKTTVVENAGHAIHVEHPEKFGKIVLSFINRYNE